MATAQLHRRLLVVVICLITFAACDDNDTFAPSSPTDPAFTGRLSGPPSIGSLSTGAVISGRITGLDLSTSAQTGGVTAPRVGIGPPGISTVVGRNGDFTLTGVPPGTVTLIFSNGGVSTGVIVSNVGFNQLIFIDVHVSGGVATIESEHRRSRSSTGG